MKSAERALWLAVSLVLLAIAVSAHRAPAPARSFDRPRAAPGVRLSMFALHQQGGVPLGWQPTQAPGNPDAGRETFVELGCQSCHHVAGERFSDDSTAARGPDLTGMGSHHPAAYFAESMLNPDAVLIDEPGYVGADGHSTMPQYPEMTVAQLGDLVAYLASLKQDVTSPGGVIMSSVDLRNRPAPPADSSGAYLAQSYDVLPGRLRACEDWFATKGRQRFLDVEGLKSVQTFVDVTRPNAITTTFGFRDENALRNFMGDPATVELVQQLDTFLGPHGHTFTDRPVAYRARSLSIE